MAATRQGRITRIAYRRCGEIYLTGRDPALGTGITIVAPITSTVRFPLNPSHTLLAADMNTGLAVISVALLDQTRAVDRMRLIKKLGLVDADTMDRVDEAIQISLGLIRL